MVTMNISLPEGLKEFVEREMAEGGFSTASEYVRQLIREAQKHKAQADLERLLVEGLDSGPVSELTPEKWEALRQRLQSGRARRKSAK